MFAAQKCRRIARARVCDFTSLPKPHAARPWSTVQAVAALPLSAVNDTVRTAVRAGAFLPAATATAAAAAHLRVRSWTRWRRAALRIFGQFPRGGVERSANGSRELRRSACAAGESMDGGGCALAITFANRLGRRKLQNLHELVTACNAWRPARRPSGRARCTAHNFGVGLVLSSRGAREDGRADLAARRRSDQRLRAARGGVGGRGDACPPTVSVHKVSRTCSPRFCT